MFGMGHVKKGYPSVDPGDLSVIQQGLASMVGAQNQEEPASGKDTVQYFLVHFFQGWSGSHSLAFRKRCAWRTR